MIRDTANPSLIPSPETGFGPLTNSINYLQDNFAFIVLIKCINYVAVILRLDNVYI